MAKVSRWSPIVFPRHQRARRLERPDAIVVTALATKALAEVVDEREKAPPLRLNLGERAGTDMIARNIARLKRLYGIADCGRVGVADRAVLMIEINLSAPHARRADHRQPGEHVLHRGIVRTFHARQTQPDRRAIESCIDAVRRQPDGKPFLGGIEQSVSGIRSRTRAKVALRVILSSRGTGIGEIGDLLNGRRELMPLSWIESGVVHGVELDWHIV